MRHLKMLGLAAVATVALGAILGAGSASASVICSTTADPCPAGQAWPNGTGIEFSLKSGTVAKLVDTEGGELDRCSGSTIGGEITNTGSSTETVTGKITALPWTGCTFTTTTINKGCWEVHKITGTSNGTVTSDTCSAANGGHNSETTINTVFFGSCIYGVGSGKSIRDVTEGMGVGVTSITNAIATKLSGSNFACPETAKMTAEYVLTTPSATTLSVSASGS